MRLGPPLLAFGKNIIRPDSSNWHVDPRMGYSLGSDWWPKDTLSMFLNFDHFCPDLYMTFYWVFFTCKPPRVTEWDEWGINLILSSFKIYFGSSFNGFFNEFWIILLGTLLRVTVWETNAASKVETLNCKTAPVIVGVKHIFHVHVRLTTQPTLVASGSCSFHLAETNFISPVYLLTYL